MGEKKALRRSEGYLLAFLWWMLVAVVIGGLCGVVGGLFAMAVEGVTHLRQEHGWLLYLLPLGGLAIVGLYRLTKLSISIGTDDIITSVRTQEKVPVLLAPAIYAGTVITHLLGGSAGREGAALQLGGSLGAAVGDLLPRRKSDQRRICELCGMAALFAALFGTPITAAIFVLEIIEVGKVNQRALMPCAVAAITGKLTAQLIGAPVDAFPLASGLAQLSAVTALQAAGMGILCALTAILFCAVMHYAGGGLKRLIPNDWVRVAVGGCAVVAVSLLLGTRDYNGGGMHVILAALGGEARPEAFLLKLLLTALTLSAGFKGGEIVPSFFVGATMGCVAASLLGMPPALGAAMGLVGVFCGVTNAPLASVVLSVELFGAEYLPLMGIVACVSFMLSGHVSIYHTQLFEQPKLGSIEE